MLISTIVKACVLGKTRSGENEGQQIEYKNAGKYLVVYIDKKLNFREDIDDVVKKSQCILCTNQPCVSSLFEKKLFTLVLQFIC